VTRALITGISGQDGSYLAELLLSEGYEVTGLVRSQHSAGSANLAAVADQLEFVTGELGDAGSLRAAVAQVAPDEIYHLAAPTSVADSWSDPEGVRGLIVDATEAVLTGAAALPDPARVFVASSSEIFGDAGESPQNEDSPKRPRTPYGEAKLAAFELVQAARANGLFAVSGITYNHESPRRPAHFLPRKVTHGAAAIALGRQETLVLGDLEAIRDWSDARDIVRGEMLALRAPEPRDYVLASGVGRTVGDLVDAAFAAAGIERTGKIEIDEAFVRPPEATTLIGDPSKARAALGWNSQIGFAMMIEDMVRADLRQLGDSN
jgi:GDPmannose 4,6-dehydratase